MNVGVDTRATRGQEFAPRVPMGTTPSPGDTLGGRKVLAVVEWGLNGVAMFAGTDLPALAHLSAQDMPSHVTAIILERETERKEP